ncbi:MAG: hypothetical protein IPN76_25740 [Saprospiraceae bacterium]|nr:hypothetical protein [Saprospiraceae bacterium]
MLSRILFFSIVYLFTFSLEVEAQDCYKKAIEKGRKFQGYGEKDKARKAWERAKTCPGADSLELANLIRSLDDFDLDGVLDAMDAVRRIRCKEQMAPMF